MSHETAVDRRIREIVRSDRRYTAAAYAFVFEALDHTMAQTGRNRRRGLDRHLTVPELLDGFRRYAREQYGPLARVTLETMGIYNTEDLGEVVFNLVAKGLLNKQETDRKEQFANGYSFREAFDEKALVRLGS